MKKSSEQQSKANEKVRIFFQSKTKKKKKNEDKGKGPGRVGHKILHSNFIMYKANFVQ